MQKLKKSKGFTLTELAIVIAVIAILIAVLVPTFVSLINNANESADKQTVKNLNTALSIDEAINGKPEYLCEVREILEEAGYNPTPTAASNDSAMYWYKTDNRVLLVKEDTVSFPAEYEGITVSDTTADSSTAKQAASVKLTASSVTSISWSELIELDTTAFVHSTGYGTDGCCPACGKQIAATASEASGEGFTVSSAGVLTAYDSTKLTSTEIVIPANVTTINSSLFDGNTSITSVIIGDNVTSIKQYAFRNCTSLTSVVIGDGNISFGVGVFSGCTSLTNFVVGDGATKLGSIISNCTSLKTVTLGKNVEKVTEGTFNTCTSLEAIEVDSENPYLKSVDGNLYSKDGTILYRWALNTNVTSVVIPDGVEEISTFAFAGSYTTAADNTNKTLTSVTLPDSLITIGKKAFQYCQAIENITIPENVTTIGESAFYSCKALESITIPDKVKSIGDEAFRYCAKLETAVIGNSVETIGEYAFSDCTLITSINIPDSVETIYRSAFSGTQITSISISANVKTLESIDTSNNYYSAFEGMLNLKEIKLDSNNENYELKEGVLYNKNCTYLVCYPSAKEGTEYIIADEVTKIYCHAFYSCNNLTSITIGNGIKTMSLVSNKSEIYNCENLTSVTVGKSFDFGLIDTKGAYTTGKATIFNNMRYLESITVDADNPYFQSLDGVLYTKNALTSGKVYLICYPAAKGDTFTIPDAVNGENVTNIGYNAFEYCKNLTVYNGKYVASISSKAFLNCENLTFDASTQEVTLSISGNAFLGGTGNKIIIGNNVTWSSTFIMMDGTSTTSDDYTINFAEEGTWSIGSDITLTVNTTKDYFEEITSTYSSYKWTYKSASE